MSVRTGPASVSDIADVVRAEIATLPFYERALGPSIFGFLRRCEGDPRRALRCVYVRQIYMGPPGRWSARDRRFQRLATRIDFPERCFPVPGRGQRDDRDYFRKVSDGFVTLEAAEHALHRLRARRIEILPVRPSSGRGADLRAFATPEFYSEAKHVRGDDGYQIISDEAESALITAGLSPLTRVDVSADRGRGPMPEAGWIEDTVMALTDGELRAIGDEIVRIARSGSAGSFAVGALTMTVDPRPFMTGMMSGAGIIPELDLAWITRRLTSKIEDGLEQLAGSRGGRHLSIDQVYVSLAVPGGVFRTDEEVRSIVEPLRRRLARRYGVRLRIRRTL